jgi:hypothetical protein
LRYNITFRRRYTLWFPTGKNRRTGKINYSFFLIRERTRKIIPAMTRPVTAAMGVRGSERGFLTSVGERDAVSPAFRVTWREKGRYPDALISTVCVPGSIFARVIGVTPSAAESTKTAAPAGLEDMESVPVSVAAAGVAVGTAVTPIAGVAGGTTVIEVRYVFLTEGLETVT